MRSPSPAWLWLINKELRELAVSRSWWVLLFAMGPLVGVPFISAARTYAEVSGMEGTAGGMGEVLSPLTGIWAPTFSACELAAVFLLPFVAIRQAGGDKQSGALKLELQQGIGAGGLMGAKAIVLLAAWLMAMLPAVSAILLWRISGGSTYAPELTALIGGHVLNGCLTLALGAAMASIAEHPSTAAILTLSITTGTWIVGFIAAVHGGWWERAVEYTPAAMTGEFQHGLVRLHSVLIAIVLIVTGFGVAALWIRLGVSAPRRAAESIGVIALAAVALFACTFAPGSWDATENRSNSFSIADERALRQIHDPLRIEVHLAPEDPRRPDLERRALSKLRRLLPNVQVRYESTSSTGIFEQTKAGYGEIRYQLGNRKATSGATTEAGVLEAIYSIAGITPPPAAEGEVYRGHPMPRVPRGAAVLFFAVWPGLVLTSAMMMRRSLR